MSHSKRLLVAGLLFFSTPAWCATYYFSTSGVTTSLPCSQAAPCSSFNGTTLDNDNALSPGDHLKFKRGDIWEGGSAEVIISSNGTAGNPIWVEAYGTGANPKLALAAVTSTSWSLYSGSIYSHGGSTSTWMDVVTQDDTKALFYWNGSLTTLPEGTFERSGTTVYVHLWGNGNPATHSVRIASFANSAAADGSRGLISIGKFTSGNTLGQHVRVRDISIIGSNGVGMTTSATDTQTLGLSIMGAGLDGWKSYCDLTSPLSPITGECGDYYRNYYDTITYSAAFANNGGIGAGQGWTTYSPYGWSIGVDSHYNAMAGFDWLNFGPSTSVTESGCIRCISYYNSLAQVDPSYDANYYVDGGTKMLLWGNIAYGEGIGIISPPGTSANMHTAYANQSEHPATDPMNNSYIGNNLCFGTHGDCLNTGSTSNNADVINWWNNTLVALNSTSYENYVIDPSGHVSTSNAYHMKNNIIYINSEWPAFPYMPTEPIGTALNYMDADYNHYYRRSGYANIYSVGDAKCKSSTPSSTCWDIARWRTNLGGTASGDESHSAFSDPLLTLDSDTALDAHLQAGSPALNTGTPTPVTLPAWIPATIATEIGPCGVKGTTLASGVLDDCATLDKGYHYSYAGLTSTNVEPASLVASVSGNATISFTMPDLVTALLYNWKVRVILPSGYSWNSGGTTAVVSSTISGTWTVAISTTTNASDTATFTRVGDGDSEFPGDYNLVVSYVGNPSSTGATGTYTIQTLDSSGTIIAYDPSVSADTITSSGATSSHFSCKGFQGKGFTIV